MSRHNEVELGGATNSLHSRNGDADDPQTRMPMMSSTGGAYARPSSNYVERFSLLLGMFAMALLVIIMAIVSATNKEVKDRFNDLNSKIVASSALGLPGYESLTWPGVLSAGKASQVVNVYVDSGSLKVQRWFTYTAVPIVFTQYGITINPIFTQPTAGIVQLIEQEVGAGKTSTGGSVDLFWANGANFYRAKTGGVIAGAVSPAFGSTESGLGNLLYGPWANKVPSADNYDWTSADIAFDMGTANDGLEMPFFAANFNIIYRTDRGITKPTTFQDLVVLLNTDACPKAASKAVCEAGTYGLKGYFSYWNPSNYLSAAFIRHFLYEGCKTTLSASLLDSTTYKAATVCAKDYIKYISGYNPALYQANVANAFQQLRFLESGFNGNSAPLNAKTNLYNSAYCASQSACVSLYQSGDIYATFEFSAPYAGSNCADTTGTGATSWGNTNVAVADLCANTMAIIPSISGAIANNNFMMIPKNAQNKLGAVVVGNWLGSMDAQYSRRYGEQADKSYKIDDGKAHSPLNRWIGNFDLNSAAYTGANGGAAWRTAYTYLESYINYPQTPPIADLRAPNALPEIDARYQTQMSADWVSCMTTTATGTTYPSVPTICP